MLSKIKLAVAVFLFINILTPTLLYAQFVDAAWIRRYNTPENNWDKAHALAVDAAGNIYVTGGSYGGATTSYDYTTIKYYPDGDTAWVRRYDGTGNSGDHAYAIAVDTFCNIYVTGWSIGSGTQADYATVKYDQNGNELWAARYDGCGGLQDCANGIVVDREGNVYVTGSSDTSDTFEDYCTIRYDNTGSQIWVRRYNGPNNYEDIATTIEQDHSGNVYVTGWSYAYLTGFDFATVKYDSSGGELWVRRYEEWGEDKAYAIAVDDSANVYVTGKGGSDYLTIKYDSSGILLWAKRYNNGGLDNANAIALHSSGNVYVTGTSHTSEMSSDFCTIKYDSFGNEGWVARYHGPGCYGNIAKAITVDYSGNVYVTGTSFGGSTYYDYATVKYDQDGNELWVKRYSGTEYDDDDVAYAIAVNTSGDLYVTGYSEGEGTSYDYGTIKYMEFYSGNVNDDWEITISDAVYLINYLFKNGAEPTPELWLGDVNCDDVVSIVDVVYLINYLFKSSSPPCQ